MLAEQSADQRRAADPAGRARGAGAAVAARRDHRAGRCWRILSLQVALFAGAGGPALPAAGARGARAARRAARSGRMPARRSSSQARGLHRTRDRTGILIFVSLGERYARIIADDGIAAKVPQAAWQRAVDELTARMSRREIAEGFLGAIAACASVLEQHFPRAEGDRNELPKQDLRNLRSNSTDLKMSPRRAMAQSREAPRRPIGPADARFNDPAAGLNAEYSTATTPGPPNLSLPNSPKFTRFRSQAVLIVPRADQDLRPTLLATWS